MFTPFYNLNLAFAVALALWMAWSPAFVAAASRFFIGISCGSLRSPSILGAAWACVCQIGKKAPVISERGV